MDDILGATSRKLRALEGELIALYVEKSKKVMLIQAELGQKETLIREMETGISELKSQIENVQAVQKEMQSLLEKRENEIQEKELKIKEQSGSISLLEQEKADLAAERDECCVQIEKNNDTTAVIEKQRKRLMVAGAFTVLLALAFAALHPWKDTQVSRNKPGAISAAVRAEIDEIKDQTGIAIEQQRYATKSNGEESITITAREEAIYFAFGETEFQPQSANILKKIAAIVRKIPKVQVEIIGHTDNTGDKTFNRMLSASRAKAVSVYFIEKEGLNPAIITIQGYGDSKPIASNDVPEGRAKNRRVEIILKPQ